VEDFDDSALGMVTEHLNRLGTVIMVFGFGMALWVLRLPIFGKWEILGWCFGGSAVVYSLILLAWIAYGGFCAMAMKIGNSVKGLVFGAVFAVLCLFLGIGGIFAAVAAASAGV
jgi:hypothetical protein